MNFDKQISYLFHLNRDDYNRADRKIGKKEERKAIIQSIK